MSEDILLRVTAVERIADAVVALDLAATDDEPLPHWEAGAHISVMVPAGRRQYSLCGPRGAGYYRIAVLRSKDSAGGSTFIHDEVRVGDTLLASGPINRFPFQSAEKYLFIAGGIGITPMLAMIDAAQKAGADWELVYGGRTLTAMAFCKDLAVYGDRVRIVPQDTDGLIDLAAALVDEPTQLVYCCGPEPLLDAVQRHAEGWSERLNYERFSAATTAISDEDDESFQVLCATSHLMVTVPTGQTMLDALRNAGAIIESDCEEGTCGTCELTYLSGVADHRDDTLLQTERDTLILPCVSRAKGQLVVDL